jgi:hypothetical protein
MNTATTRQAALPEKTTHFIFNSAFLKMILMGLLWLIIGGENAGCQICDRFDRIDRIDGVDRIGADDYAGGVDSDVSKVNKVKKSHNQGVPHA